MVFRKAVLQQIGGFDPQFTAAGDDVDICWRALDAGFILGFCPAAFVWHFRRNTVKAYYGQQRGYGKAEAMLYFKYPERFNALGQVMWRGRIPGLARTLPGARSLVAWARTSSGFFQTIYEPPMGLLKFLPQTLEWNALWSAVLVFSLMAGFTCVPALLMLVLGPIWALYYAWKAPLEKCHDRFGSRLEVAFLAYSGPMFRTITRYRYRLAGIWSGAGGVEPAPRQRPAIALRQRSLKLAYWSENGIPRDSLIDRLVKLFTRAAMPVRVDSGWNDYDLEIQPDSWTRVRIKTADEEHEGGKLQNRRPGPGKVERAEQNPARLERAGRSSRHADAGNRVNQTDAGRPDGRDSLDSAERSNRVRPDCVPRNRAMRRRPGPDPARHRLRARAGPRARPHRDDR